MGMFGHPNVGSLRYIISFLFDNKLTELLQYVHTVGEAFENKLNELGKDFDEKTKDMTPEQHQAARTAPAINVESRRFSAERAGKSTAVGLGSTVIRSCDGVFHERGQKRATKGSTRKPRSGTRCEHAVYGTGASPRRRRLGSRPVDLSADSDIYAPEKAPWHTLGRRRRAISEISGPVVFSWKHTLLPAVFPAGQTSQCLSHLRRVVQRGLAR
jgi:hypothetical protein